MSKRIAIVGAGALGQQIAQHLQQCGRAVAGFFDDALPSGNSGSTVSGRILGPLTTIISAHAAGTFDELLLAIGYNHLPARARLFGELQAASVPFAQFVHPSTYVDASATLGPGVFVSPGCVLDLNVTLHANVFVYPGCVLAHESQVGAHSVLAPGVRLAGRARVGERCFLGVGTTVIDKLTLGDDVRTGAGSVVIRDLLETGTYAGVPACRLVSK